MMSALSGTEKLDLPLALRADFGLAEFFWIPEVPESLAWVFRTLMRFWRIERFV